MACPWSFPVLERVDKTATFKIRIVQKRKIECNFGPWVSISLHEDIFLFTPLPFPSYHLVPNSCRQSHPWRLRLMINSHLHLDIADN